MSDSESRRNDRDRRIFPRLIIESRKRNISFAFLFSGRDLPFIRVIIGVIDRESRLRVQESAWIVFEVYSATVETRPSGNAKPRMR